jgi:hypothetical protein
MGKSGFASAVGSCNDDDFLQQEPLTVLLYPEQFYVQGCYSLKPISSIRSDLKILISIGASAGIKN